MTSKEQERKALAQIRKIVADLGEDSYIGTAFEGCFEIAEENIENDFACSMKQRTEAAEKVESELREKIATLTKQCEAHKAAREVAEQHMQLEAERARSYVLKYQSMKNLADEQERAKVEANGQLEALKDTIADKDDEIIHLKAKLFDLMMAAK